MEILLKENERIDDLEYNAEEYGKISSTNVTFAYSSWERL